MSSVRRDGQTVGKNTTNDLDDHKEEAEDTGDDQLAAGTLVHVADWSVGRVTMKLWKKNCQKCNQLVINLNNSGTLDYN